MPTLPTNAMTRLGNWFWPNHYGSGDANGSWPEQWAIDVNQSPDASDFSRITSGTPAWGAGDTIGSTLNVVHNIFDEGFREHFAVNLSNVGAAAIATPASNGIVQSNVPDPAVISGTILDGSFSFPVSLQRTDGAAIDQTSPRGSLSTAGTAVRKDLALSLLPSKVNVHRIRYWSSIGL